MQNIATLGYPLFSDRARKVLYSSLDLEVLKLQKSYLYQATSIKCPGEWICCQNRQGAGSPYFDPANRLSCIRPVNAKTRSVVVFLKQIPGCHGERSQEFSYHAPSLSCGWEPLIIVAPTASPFHRKYEIAE